MEPDQPDQKQAQTPPPEEPAVSEPIPQTEASPAEPTPETSSMPPNSPNPPDVPEPEEAPVPQPEPMPPPTPADVPIPNFRFPFNGDFPVTFAFNASPTTEEMKAKFQEWGITGHHGVDFGLSEGTEVVAVDSGKVIQSDENGDYGNSVTIQHSWGQSLYAHLKETKVAVDQDINPGDVIGFSGQTGAAFGPHLHFGIKPNNPNETNGYLGFIDPASYLPQIPQIPNEPLPAPEPKPEESKPPEQPVETPAPVISEPTINIEPVSPPPSPPPAPAPVVDIQAKIDEALKQEQAQRMVLANQARAEKKTEHLNKILSFAQEKREITNEQVRDLLHVSQSTATNYLTELVNKGQLRIDKKAKATTYLY